RFVLFQVGGQLVDELFQFQEIMVGIARDKLIRRVIAVARINQLNRVHQVTAGIALVAARVRISAVVERPLDKPVRQEALFLLAVKQRLAFDAQIAAFQQAREEILRDAMVILGIGMGEQVIADANFLLCQQEALVIFLEQFQRANALLAR